MDALEQLKDSFAATGRYTIEREIGAGGMATVYLARDERYGRPVAIKVLRQVEWQRCCMYNVSMTSV